MQAATGRSTAQRRVSRQARAACAQRPALHAAVAPTIQRTLHTSLSRRASPLAAATNPFETTSTTSARPVPSASPSGAAAKATPPYSLHKWTWRGHTINYATAGCGQPILLVHGFGASVGHWRKNIAELSKSYKVYAVDLLGFGASDKPIIPYSMELWRDLLVDFSTEFIDRPFVLVGNSIGSLACLMANAALPKGRAAGTVLLNSAGAMNNKGVVGDWRIVLVYPIFLLIDLLLSIRPVAAYLFDSFRSRDNIRTVLTNVYRNAAAVDDELVDIIYEPSCGPTALDVFVSVITGPPGPKPWDLVPQTQGPLLVLWGDKDTFTPADGPVGRFFRELPDKEPRARFCFLEDVGHCPHDDRPELVHAQLLPWLRTAAFGGAAGCEESA